MGCEDCEKMNEGQEGIAYYRWKNATIGLMGCPKHLKEIIDVLNEYQQELHKTRY